MNVHGYSSTIMAAALNMDLGFESAESHPPPPPRSCYLL